jgi:hypothetical protein
MEVKVGQSVDEINRFKGCSGDLISVQEAWGSYGRSK